MLSSIVPSSRFLIRMLLDPVNWGRARVIVEYGPGVGGITTEVLRRMRPDATLIAIEINPEFVRYLGRTLSDPRVRVIEGSAASVEEIVRRFGFGHADYVICGIPLTNLPQDKRSALLRRTHDLLAPGGAFLVYQFSSRISAELARVFGHVERRFELRNFLPAHLFICQPIHG